MKNTFTAVSRITLGLVFLSATTWILAIALGMTRDPRMDATQNRVQLTEQAAVNCSLFASRNDLEAIRASLSALVKRHSEVNSAAVRQHGGSIIASVGEHASLWTIGADEKSTSSQMKVNVFANGDHWGQVELCFQPIPVWSITNFWHHPSANFFTFCLATSALLFSWFLRRVLVQLDPSQAVPDRVRNALDIFSEGVVVIDENERIVLANDAFAKTAKEDSAKLIGRCLSELKWERNDDPNEGEAFPWQYTLSTGEAQLGHLLTTGELHQRKHLRVNASPILNEEGAPRGVLMSFEDITEIENKKSRLMRMLSILRESREQVREQNQVLKVLAATDALTGCLNRRAFFERFDTAWRDAIDHQMDLSCIMVDIDYFKSINDTHGHAKGDKVLQVIGEMLRRLTKGHGVVGRYGGEEFCVLLPDASLEQAQSMAETIRTEIESSKIDGLDVTASLGASGREFAASTLQELLAQADKCLYVAKCEGRNRVVTWKMEYEQIEEGTVSRDKSTSSQTEEPCRLDESDIPYSTVSALLSTIAYRDLATALHSIRVSEYGVLLAREYMSVRDVYVLEIAGLLHDIGKIGVSDSVLFKPGGLTQREWHVMQRRIPIGCEIVQASFHCPQLYELIRHCHQSYRRNGNGEIQEIPLGSRIIAIADAYDSMTTDSTYRGALSREEAFAELRARAGTQFDPELVEKFIDVVTPFDSQQLVTGETISPQTALKLGANTERLAAAVESHDFAAVQQIAEKLAAIASENQMYSVRKVARQLRAAKGQNADISQLIETTHELLNLCRQAQRQYVEGATPWFSDFQREGAECFDSFSS